MPTYAALFNLGQIVATPGAIELLEQCETLASQLLEKHQSGDFGDLCEDDRRANLDAIRNDARIFSSYQMNENDKVWIITEADRSSTCLLLPDEY